MGNFRNSVYINNINYRIAKLFQIYQARIFAHSLSKIFRIVRIFRIFRFVGHVCEFIYVVLSVFRER